jgi:hypothetical protein
MFKSASTPSVSIFEIMESINCSCVCVKAPFLKLVVSQKIIDIIELFKTPAICTSDYLFLCHLCHFCSPSKSSQDFVTPCIQGVTKVITYKGLQSKNGTGRHGPSIQSGMTELAHFFICYVRDTLYTSRLHLYEI